MNKDKTYLNIDTEKLLSEMNNANDRYEKDYARLCGLVKEFSPLLLLTALSIVTRIRQKVEIQVPENEPGLGELQIDILQCLVLEHGNLLLPKTQATSNNIQELLDILLILPRTYELKMMGSFHNSDNKKSSRDFRSQLHRRNTIFRRNWGYLDDIIELGQELVAPIDDYIVSEQPTPKSCSSSVQSN